MKTCRAASLRDATDKSGRFLRMLYIAIRKGGVKSETKHLTDY